MGWILLALLFTCLIAGGLHTASRRAALLRAASKPEASRAPSPFAAPARSSPASPQNVRNWTTVDHVLVGCGWLAILTYVIALIVKTGWKGHPLEPTSREDADLLALRAALLISIFVLSALVAFYGLPDIARVAGLPVLNSRVLDLFISDVVTIGLTAAILKVPLGMRRVGLRQLGLDLTHLRPTLCWGFGGFLACLSLAKLGAIIGHRLFGFAPSVSDGIYSFLRQPYDWVSISVALLSGCVSAPFFEEITHRGSVMPAIAALFNNQEVGRIVAILASSLLFAACHSTGLPTWPSLMGYGLVAAVLAYQTKSLLPGMIMHGLVNGYVMTSHLLLAAWRPR